MMSRDTVQTLKLWYPFLFALLPILHILTRNPGGSRLDDVAVVSASALVVTGVLYLITLVALRGRVRRAVIPVLVFLAVFMAYGKAPLGTLSRHLAGAPPILLAVSVLGLLLGGVWWLARRPAALDRVNTFFTLTGLLMTAWLGFRFVANLRHAQELVRQSRVVRELTQPIPVPAASSRSAPQRDVYLIVLDEYANAGVLAEEFQFDNRMFEDSLRQLGFTIPVSVHSNYVHTLLSLPSLLNFSHLTGLTQEVGARSTDATLPNYLLENNRTAAFFKEMGYRFLFFPSQWWPSTSRNRNADWQFNPWRGLNLGRAATRSDLRRSLLATTAFDLLEHGQSWDADYIRQTLTALERVPERADPTFTFAHIVSPHWPYVFGGDCRVAKEHEGNARGARKRAYTEQLRCLNQMVLHTVTTILQRSAVAPIVLLQGDHGTNLLRYSEAASATAVTPDQARERFGAFGAYYLPAGGGALFADSVTVVNVMERVLKHYYGATLPASPDDLYMSLERTPYNFARIDPASFRPLNTAAN